MTDLAAGYRSASKVWWDVHLNGRVEIAGQELQADGVIDHGKLAVVAIEKIPAIRISALFDQFFGKAAKGKLSWPTDIVDLGLADSLIFYSYVDGARLGRIPPTLLPLEIVRLAKRIAGKGLYIATRLDLVLVDHTFPPVDAQIDVVEGHGFKLDGKLTKKIELPSANLNVIGLTGPDGSGGPMLSLQSFDGAKAKRAFTMDCRISLLDATPVKTTVHVEKNAEGGAPDFAATLTYSDDIGPFKSPTLQISWSKKGGFHISGFPHIQVPKVALDFASLLKQASAGGGCGKLADLAMKKGLAMEQHFFASPSISLTKPGAAAADGHLYVIVNGTYKISAKGHTVVEKALPQLVWQLEAPKSFEFNNLLDYLFQAITSGAVQIVEELWRDRRQLANLMAVFVSVEALKKIGEKAVGKACEELKKLAEEFAGKLKDGALNTVEGALNGAASAAGAIGGACHHGGGGHHHGGGGHGDPPPVPRLPAPDVKSVAYSQGAVEIAWNPVSDAAGYELQMFDSARNPVGPVQRLKQDKHTASIAVDPPHVAAGACAVQIKALAPVASVELDSKFANAAIRKLDPPTVKCFALKNGRVSVSWSDVKTRGGYRIRMIDAVGATFEIPGVVDKKLTSTTVDLPQGLAGGLIHVQLQAISSSAIRSDWSQRSKEGIEKLQTPVIDTLVCREDQLTASWNGSARNNGYRLQLTTSAGIPVGDPIKVAKPKNKGSTDTGSIKLPADLKPGNYKVTVQAAAEANAAIDSDWSAGRSIEKPATIRIVQVDDQNGRLVLALGKKSREGPYGIEIVGLEKKTPVMRHAVAAKETLTVNSRDLAPGKYTVKARVNAAAGSIIPADWSDGVSFSHHESVGVAYVIKVDYGTIGDIAVDPERDRIYASVPTNEAGQVMNRIVVIDGKDYEATGSLTVGHLPEQLAIDTSSGLVYAANKADNSVSGVDSKIGKIVSATGLPGAPTALAFNRAAGKIYAGCGTSVLAFKPGLETKTTPIAVDGRPAALLANSARNEVYVICDKVAAISVIDGKSDKVVAKFSTPGLPVAMAVNQRRHELYVIYHGRPDLSVFSTTNRKTKSGFEIGDESGNFVSLAANVADDVVYAANVSGKAIVVADPENPGGLRWVKLDFAPEILAVNDKTSEIYVAGKSGQSITVVYDPSKRHSKPTLKIGDDHAGGTIFSLNADGASGTVVSKKDVTPARDWASARQACEAYAAGGFKDWQLPTTAQWDAIFAKLIEACPKCGIDRSQFYWTSSTGYGTGWYRAMDLKKVKTFEDRHPIFYESVPCLVRAVRKF